MWISKYFFLRKLTGHHKRIKYIKDFAKSLKYVYLSINLWGLFFLEFFASHSVCTTVAQITNTWLKKLIDEIGSTVFHRNLCCEFATGGTITKADLPFNCTIFLCRMSTIQPAWPVCTTSVWWHTRCWHFCSCSSYKTIPSLRKLLVTQFWTDLSFVTYLSISITQVFIMTAMIRCKVK